MAHLDALLESDQLSDFEAWMADWRRQAPSAEDKYSPQDLVRVFTAWSRCQKVEPPAPPAPSTDTTVRLVLNVMMKNEQPVMARCLQSALPVVDAVSYSDTGSTGDAFSLLRTLVPTNLPLNVAIEPWQNFGYNRTEGLEQTRRFILRQGWNPRTTYILVIDADMVLHVAAGFRKDTLTAACYDLEQHNGSSVYWNPRLLRLDVGWEVVGRTHEYYAAKGPAPHEPLRTLHVEDRNDGTNRTEKFNRDIVLLLEDLVDQPRNARAMFYLGESYRNRGQAGDYAKALTYYKKHFATGSWEEEMWYSLYAQGLCHEQLQDAPSMLEAHLRAYQYRPRRAEPLYHLGHYYHSREQHWTAMLFFKKALALPFPTEDLLFVDKDIYQFRLLSDAAISAFYAGERKLGAECTQTLLRRPGIPQSIKDMAFYNMRFYIEAPPAQRSLKLHPAALPSPYQPCNPSLVFPTASSLVINCRGVNYRQRKARGYQHLDQLGYFHTHNVLLELDPVTWEIRSDQLIQNVPSGPYVSTCGVRGLEDARILVDPQGHLAFSCTTLEHTEDNRPRLAWTVLDHASSQVQSVTRITGHEDHLIQKNWLPFVDQGQLFFLYSYHPLTILRMDPATCQVQVHQTSTLPVSAEHWRGSAGPVKVDDEGWIFLIHEVCDRAEGRHYMHRWVWLDAQWQTLKGVSDLLYFKHKDGVEMVTGLAYREGSFYLTLGVEDCEAHLLQYDRDTIFPLLTTA